MVIGQTHTFLFLARNMNTGMSDVKESALRMPDSLMLQQLSLVADIILSIKINVLRARQECSEDYSTMIDVADALYEKNNVPFRIGHHFASLLTDHGRENAIFPLDIPYEQAKKIYRSMDNKELPLTEQELRQSLDPVAFVNSRKGRGGPQPAEVERQLKVARAALEKEEQRNSRRTNALKASKDRLAAEFQSLLV